MDPEGDNYADPAGPPPRVDLALVACVVMGVAILAACVVWNRLVPTGP